MRLLLRAESCLLGRGTPFVPDGIPGLVDPLDVIPGRLVEPDVIPGSVGAGAATGNNGARQSTELSDDESLDDDDEVEVLRPAASGGFSASGSPLEGVRSAGGGSSGCLDPDDVPGSSGGGSSN